MVDHERPFRILVCQVVVELGIFRLIAIDRVYLKDAEPLGKILDDGYVVQIDLKLGQVVVQVDYLQLDSVGS